MPFITFLYQQITAISFIFLMLALVSLWIKKSSWLWGSLGTVSLFLAFSSKLLTSAALIPLSILTAIFWGLQWNVNGLGRYLLVTAGFLIAAALFYHILLGFPAPIEFFGAEISYGKILAALLLLAWPVSTLSSREERTQFLKGSLPLALLGAFLLLIVVFYLQITAWHPKFSLNFFSWSILYLICTIIPEEALLRGFMQKEIFQLIGGGFKSHVGAIFISGALFSLFHLSWITKPATFPLILLSGFIYSTLYQITKYVETSILCRFVVSALYLLFFSGSANIF